MTISDSSQSALYCVDVNPLNGLAVAGDLDGRVSMFDVNQRCKVSSFDAHSDPISSIRWNADGVDFLTAGNDGVVRVWDSRHSSCCKVTVESLNKSPMSVMVSITID